MEKRKDHRNVVIAFFAVMILFTVAERISAPLNFASTFITSSFARYVFFAGGGQKDESRYASQLSREEELERLYAELAKSDSEIQHLTQMLKSVSDFRQGYEFSKLSVVPAGVLTRSDSSNFRRSIVVDRGRNDGILPGMVAVRGLTQSPDRGLSGAVIGQVVSVSDSASRVLLISDPALRISVLVLETQDEGVCEGTPVSPFPLAVKYIDSASAVKVGDRIVTSGSAGNFPRGLLIGTVAARRTPGRGYSPLLTVGVRPAVDFDQISHVLILKTGAAPPDEGEK